MAHTRSEFRNRIKTLVISAAKAVRDALDLINRVQSKRAEKRSGLATDRAGKGGGALGPVKQDLSQALAELQQLDDKIEGVVHAQPGADVSAEASDPSQAKSQGGVDD